MKRPKKQREEMEPKDLMRLESIRDRADGDRWKAQQYAENMANAITDPAKAFGRYLAALKVFGEGRVSKVFLNRATALGHVAAEGHSAIDMLL